MSHLLCITMSSSTEKRVNDDQDLSEVISRIDTAGNPAALPKKRFNFWTALSMSVCSSGAVSSSVHIDELHTETL